MSEEDLKRYLECYVDEKLKDLTSSFHKLSGKVDIMVPLTVATFVGVAGIFLGVVSIIIVAATASAGGD